MPALLLLVAPTQQASSVVDSSTVCAGSKVLLANRMARLFVVAYLVLLHLFVVAMLYIWSAGGGSSAEIDIAALAPLMAPSAQARSHTGSDAG